MLWIEPESCTVNGTSVGGVLSVALSQRGESVVVSYGDGGPHPGFVDVAGVRSIFVIRRAVVEPGDVPAAVGDRVALVVRGRSSSASGAVHRASSQVVITKSEWSVDRRSGLTHILESVAFGSDPASDPVSVEKVEVA